MARQHVRVVNETSLMRDGVVRVRVPSPGLFVPTHQSLDCFSGYLKTGEQDMRVFLKPGISGVFLAEDEAVGFVTALKEVG